MGDSFEKELGLIFELGGQGLEVKFLERMTFNNLGNHGKIHGHVIYELRNEPRVIITYSQTHGLEPPVHSLRGLMFKGVYSLHEEGLVVYIGCNAPPVEGHYAFHVGEIKKAGRKHG
jgi:hypothetical protein